MSLEQRIGQLFLLGLAQNQLGQAEIDAIRDQHVGSVWFIWTTSMALAEVRAITVAVQALASKSSTGRVGFFIAANQEGGEIQALEGQGFSTIPSAVEQGKQSLDQLRANARRWGRELANAGVNLDFAPVADVVPSGNVATNQPIGVLHREYGSDPEAAGAHAAAFMSGLAASGVATTAKHFPGLGRVSGNTDFTSGVVDETTTTSDPFLDSFRSVIDAGVPFVMVSLATYTKIDSDRIAAFSPAVIQGLLRTDLGFEGAVLSDDLDDTAAVADIPIADRAVDFLLAGGDVVVSKRSEVTLAMVASVLARAESDASFAARVDEAALRVLLAKRAAGLLPC